ncbi:hypothetical protein GGU11DRAFT_751193 [Lentinula aff. detonsa]|nr:hypothetical protein GGU11DRAFT_751193 [Lentinula aff. detonsa]
MAFYLTWALAAPNPTKGYPTGALALATTAVLVSPRSRDLIPAFAEYNSARELPIISPDRNLIHTIPFISIPLFFLMSTNLFGDSTYATLT